jgi:hypothetical protein
LDKLTGRTGVPNHCSAKRFCAIRFSAQILPRCFGVAGLWHGTDPRFAQISGFALQQVTLLLLFEPPVRMNDDLRK